MRSGLCGRLAWTKAEDALHESVSLRLRNMAVPANMELMIHGESVSLRLRNMAAPANVELMIHGAQSRISPGSHLAVALHNWHLR